MLLPSTSQAYVAGKCYDHQIVSHNLADSPKSSTLHDVQQIIVLRNYTFNNVVVTSSTVSPALCCELP